MKKILFCVICILACFSMVNAKTQIEYDWGICVPSSFMDARIYKDSFFLFNSTAKHVWDAHYDKYDLDGNKVNSVKRDNNEVFYIFNDVIMSFTYGGTEYYHTIYDENFNVIEKKPFIKDADGLDWYNYGETEDYYYIGVDMITKDTYEYIDVSGTIYNHPDYSPKCDSFTPENIRECFDIATRLAEENYSGTHVPMFFNIYSTNMWFDEYEIAEVFINGKDGLTVSYYDYETELYGLVFYDNNGQIIKQLAAEDRINPSVFYANNRIYVVRMLSRLSSNNQLEYYFNLVEYDKKFNILSENELVSFEGDNKINFELSSESFIENILLVDDGFIVFTDHYYFNLDNEDEYLKTILPAVLKYNFVYSVDTIGNENGTIEVDKGSSKTGEMIKYNIQPKDGYKLEKVIVTDDSGNTIEIKDSSFVMPSSNVTIEAVFVVDNPNTGVFLKVGIACIITFVCYFFIILKNMKVKQYE